MKQLFTRITSRSLRQCLPGLFLLLPLLCRGQVAGSSPGPGRAASPTAPDPIAAKRWTGGAGTTSWFDAANWDGGTVPASTDDVILDHRAVGGKYTVSLTTTTTAVTVNSLRIRPFAGDSILLLVPSTNTVAGALTLTRATAGDTALYVSGKGAVIDRSGASSGTPIDASGSNPTVFLLNGGSFYHRTARGHAMLVENLSAAAGTESGNFFFRIPGAGSTTASVSNRTFGNLYFETGGRSSYTSAGSSSLTINGNLTTGAGVTFKLSLTNSLVLKGNLRNNGNLVFDPATGGSGRLLLQGTAPQVVAGTELGDPATAGSYLAATVQLEINNASGVTLQTPLLLGNVFTLTSGLLTTDASNILTLAQAATVSGGSGSSYVSGPVRRPIADVSAATSFVFPVGKAGAYRPLTLTVTSQTGTINYRAEQFESNADRSLAPASASDPGHTDLTRVSTLRYFTLTPYNSAQVPVVTQPTNFAGTVTLSYGPDDQVTDPSLASLVVAKRGGITQPWYDFGHGGSTGSASGGTLTSGTITSFSDFALGSTADKTSNPLPVQLTTFTAQRTATGPVALAWTTASELRSARFEVERSLDGQAFAAVARVAAQGSSLQTSRYAAHDAYPPATRLYYRLRLVDADGSFAYSAVATVGGSPGELMLSPNPAGEQVSFYTEQATPYLLRSALGQVVREGRTQAGGLTQLDVRELASGVYFLELSTAAGRLMRRFVRE